MVSHVVLTMATYALAMAYRGFEGEDVKKDGKSHRSFKNGTNRWRRRKQRDYRDHVIIFIGYGIFHLEELVILMGINNVNYAKAKEQIYRRRGLNPPV